MRNTCVWLLLSLCARQAACIPFRYTVVEHGIGPGIGEKTAVAKVTTQKVGDCARCQDPNWNSNGGPFCIEAIDDPALFGGAGPIAQVKDVVAAAPDGTNAHMTIQSSKDVELTGAWSVVGGGSFTPPCADNCSFDAVLPPGTYDLAFSALFVGGTESLAVCGCFACINGPGCCSCDKGPACGFGGVATATVTYLGLSDQAPIQCPKSGNGDLPADGLWHFVDTISCLPSKSKPTSWEVSLSGVPALSYAEGWMVDNPADAIAGKAVSNGPNLIVRIVTLDPCPPNCAPPDPCMECLKKSSLKDCQDVGGGKPGPCPGGCPPYCPPPPGCPEDQSKCPPPPKCPPYCPPPPGCPEDSSKCPKGCPPICAPPPGCPPDCPEPPGCPPNCPPPDDCQACLQSGKTQVQCEQSGACPQGCPPKCAAPAGCAK